MRIELCDLGDWGARPLLAEYDPEARTIRIATRAHARIRDRLGEPLAAAFIAHAVAHERFHVAHPDGSESQARAFAHAISGVGAAVFEAALRA